MNPIKIVFIWIVLLSLSACGGGSGSTAASNTLAKTYQGVVQKGPFIIGTDVQISLLDESGVATGDVVVAKIIDNNGTFEYQIPIDWLLEGLMLEISSQGVFLDESSGQNTTRSVLLTALTNNPENSSVNLLTHWANNRTKALNLSGKSLKNAFEQANNEIKALLGIDTLNQLDFTDTNQNRESNALLLLLSGSLMEVANQDSENINAIIAQISSDFSEDGALNLIGSKWLKRMQAKIRDNPLGHTDMYADNLKKEIGSEIVSGKSLPRLIPLASRPVAIAPAVIFAKPGETIFLDGSASHDSGELINFTWFRVDQQTQFNVPVSDRFVERPSITVPSQESELLYALVVTDADKLTDTTVVKVIVIVPPAENNPPIANSRIGEGSVFTNEDTPVNILLTGSDPDSDPISFVISTPLLLPNGLLEGIAPNLTYTPTQDYFGSDTFTFLVNDGSANSNVATVDIFVGSVNDPPIANAGLDQSKQSSESVSLNGSGSDVDGTIASYFWIQTSGSTVTLNDNSIAAPTFTAPVVFSVPETLTFQLVVTDNDGAPSIADIMDVVVLSLPNVSPTADAGIDRTTQVNQSITITGSGTDSDGTIASYEWRLGATVLATTASFSYTPTVVGTDTLSLTVIDNDGATSTADTMNVVVTATPNLPPTANAGINRTTQVNQSTTITGSGTDSDGTIASFEWRIGATVLATTASFSYTPTTVGTDTLSLTVIDNDGATSTADTMNVVVTATPNLPPTANAGINRTTQVNQSITITGSGTDSDGTIASYEWRLGATVLATTASFSYTPTVVGTDTLSLTVTDNDGATSTADTMNVVVTATPNQAPIATSATVNNSLPDPQGPIIFNLFQFVSDPEGDPLTYEIISVEGGAGSDFPMRFDFTNLPIVIASGPQDIPVNRIFTYQVTDDNTNKSTIETITVRYNFINSPPVADAGPAQLVEVITTTPTDSLFIEVAQVILDGSGSSDPNSDNLTYSWAQTGGPVNLGTIGSSVNPTINILGEPNVHIEGTYTFELVVTDDGTGNLSSLPSSVVISVEHFL